MTKSVLNIVLIITLIMFPGASVNSHADEHEQTKVFLDQTEVYTLDPMISGGANAPYGPTKSQGITVGKRENQTQIQL